MSIHDLEAIDVHGHYGDFDREGQPLYGRFVSADPQTVVSRARMARIKLSIVSPMQALAARGPLDALTGNEDAAAQAAQCDELLQWMVVNPLDPRTSDQAEEMLDLPQCVGIKMHPDGHRYKVADHGRMLFELAAKHKTVLQSHSGCPNSVPAEFVPFANEFPEVTLILSHLGNGFDNDLTHQVRAIQASKHGNIYTDTSSANSIMPELIEWAVAEVGADRILFGTDTPCYYAPWQRARIDCADIDDDDKRRILFGNAAEMFNLSV